MMKIPSPIGNPLMEPSDLTGQLTVPATPSFAASSLLLQDSQLSLGLSEPPWILHMFPVGKSGEMCQSHINPYFRKIAHRTLWFRKLNLEADEPVADPVFFENSHFDDAICRDFPVLEKTDEPYILDIEPVVTQPEAIIVDITNRLERPSSLETGIAWFLLSRLQASEEAIKSLVQPAEGLLEGGMVAPGHIGIEVADFRELVGLIVVADADTALAPGFPSFLKSIVVDLAVDLQVTAEVLALLLIWVKTVFVAKKHLIIIAQMFLSANNNVRLKFPHSPGSSKQSVPSGGFYGKSVQGKV